MIKWTKWVIFYRNFFILYLFFLGGFFISVSLQPSGRTILDFAEEKNFHFLKPVSIIEISKIMIYFFYRLNSEASIFSSKRSFMIELDLSLSLSLFNLLSSENRSIMIELSLSLFNFHRKSLNYDRTRSLYRLSIMI